MKGFLGCCYQRDVPPETIKNLRIVPHFNIYRTLKTINIRLYLHTQQSVQLQLEKFFCFFLGWARPDNRLVSSGWARPV